MGMRGRKFAKRILKVKYLVALLILICLGTIGIIYFAVGIDANAIEIDNMDFTTEGFENYFEKSDSEINTNKIVSQNEKFIMFIDESTTIVTVCEKDSLIEGTTGQKSTDYRIKYSSAATAEGAPIAQLGNFNLTYSSTNISYPVTKTINSYTSSVKYVDGITLEEQRRYSIKYEEDAVQIYYSIGEFTSIATRFSQQLYSTVYAPARCLYDTEAEWEKAVAEYEDSYLSVVKSINNTFEEKFRGNVQIASRADKNDATQQYIVSYRPQITVYTQEALEYILDVVFPALENDGLTIPYYDKEELFNEARENAEKNKNKESVKWVLNDVPLELLDCDGEYYNRFFNIEGSPLTNNPFLLNTHFVNLSPGPYTFIKADGSTVLHSYYKLSVNPGPAAKSLNNYLYSDEQSVQTANNKEYKYVKEVDGEFVPFASSGYVARDEDGNAIRDEEGKLVKQLYTTEQVEFDNELFNIVTEGAAVFKVAMEFKLTDKGVVVTIPTESLIDSTNVSKDDPDYNLINGVYQMVDIKICPNMTNANDTQQGYIIVPDGSGAIINFNNGKTSTVSATYYGKDMAYVDVVKTEDTAKLLLGMFAFVNTTPENPGGLLAVIEKGGGQISLTAGVSSQFKENYANLTAILRNKEAVLTGTVSDTSSYDKFDKRLTPSDIVINYLIIDETETEYYQVAKKYQQYLIERDGLDYNDQTNETLNDLTFLGTFEKYALFLGVKYMTEDTLTTFDQAIEILDELYINKVDNLTVSYKGWTNEFLEYELGGKLKVARVLGKTKSMQKFYEYCVSRNATFYPELSITTNKGYDYLFGSTKYTARGVGNEEAIHYVYDLATGRPNKKLKKTYALSPLYYKSVTEDLLEQFNKLNVWNKKENGGFYLTDLGNKWSGNYRVNRQVYGGDAILYQQQALEMLSQNNKIKIEAPCDYAFKYVDVATGVPVTSSMYTIYDQTIPFYQLVISGLFDYTTEHINGMSNRSSAWYLAKILETGSNVSYMLSAEDPAILLETDYTQYYQAYYNNWKDTIINFNSVIDGIGIHNCYLTKHENVNGLSRVTYTNKTNPAQEIILVINVSDAAKNYNNKIIPAYGYIVEE